MAPTGALYNINKENDDEDAQGAEGHIRAAPPNDYS